jgi:hypothetical protein
MNVSEIETGVAEKPSWDQTNRRQKNMAWFGEIERKLAKLSKSPFLPFFLLIIL